MEPTLFYGIEGPAAAKRREPLCRKQGLMIMKELECPFTWDNVIVFDDDDDTNVMIDRLPLAIDPWDSIIQKCHLAYSEFKRGNIPDSSRFMAECFIPLLEVPGLETSCDMTKIYRQGLKHVLDATSAFIRLHDVQEEMSRQLLISFVAGIPSVDDLNEKQRSAISAIRSRMTSYPDNKLYAQTAITLDPHQGEWHFYVAKSIYDAEESGMKETHDPAEMGDLLNHNKIALFSKRKTPAPVLLMAHLILTYGHPSSPQLEKAHESIKKALIQFPNSAYVHDQAAVITIKCTPMLSDVPNYRMIQCHYKEALRLSGKEILSVRHRLGINQVLESGQMPPLCHEGLLLRAEGIDNLKRARHLTAETQIHYELAVEDALNFSALGQFPRFMYAGWDDWKENPTSAKGRKKARKLKKVYRKKK